MRADSRGNQSATDWKSLAPFTRENNSKLAEVDISHLPIVLDLRYSTTKNFTGVRMYPRGLDGTKLFLHEKCVPNLENAARAAAKENGNCKLIVFDGARPCSAQLHMWDFITADPRRFPKPHTFVASSPGCRKGVKGEDAMKVSMHNLGLAIDLSLDCSGGRNIQEPEQVIRTMGGDFDDPATGEFDFGNLSNEQKANRERLRRIMKSAGFFDYSHEWWHFNCLSPRPTDSLQYPVIR